MLPIKIFCLVVFICDWTFAQHGAPCTPGGSCGSDDLECSPTNECQCLGEHLSSSDFDIPSQTCFRLPEETCQMPLKIKCFPTSSCLNKKCTCQGLLEYSAADRRCYLELDKPCNQNHDLCNPNKFLKCDQLGKCSCPDGIFDSASDVCVLLPEAKCDTSIPDTPICKPPSTCTSGVCECPLGSSAGKEGQDFGKCVLYHGAICDSSPDYPICSESRHLTCDSTTTTCLCEGEGTTAIFDLKSQTCRVLAGEDCIFDSVDSMQCVPKSKCQKTNGGSKCECIPPLQMSIDKQCYLGEGEQCSIENDLCDRNKLLKCNLEGKCSCPGGFLDSGLVPEKCVLYPGAECAFGDINQPECIPPTACKQTPAKNDLIKFKCLCPSGSIPGKRESKDFGKCVLQYKDSCDPASNVICSEARHLECDSFWKHCLCKGEGVSTIVERESLTCKILAGESCSNEADAMKCISKSVCRNRTTATATESKCECREPLEMNPKNKQCYLGLDQSCSQDNDLCDHNKFLECDLEGKCSCPSGKSFYKPDVDKCVLLPNSKCTPVLPGTSELIACDEPTTTCVGGRCKCPAASEQSKIDPQLCAISQGEPCGQNPDLCDPYAFLECTQVGQCRCRGRGGNAQSTFWDDQSSKCFLKADTSCNATYPLAQKCHPNSHCFNQNNVAQCICDPGFVKNRQRRCYLSLGSKCSLTNDLCDPTSFLHCDLKNNCTCRSDAIYNQETETCELIPGTECNPTNYTEYQKCIPNAICPESTKICECVGDLRPNVDNLCYLNYGFYCIPSEDLCDPASFLSCSMDQMKCICQGEEDGLAIWNPYAQKCFLLEGSSCINISSSYLENRNQNCVPNSHCDSSDLKCTCNNATLIPNQNGMCYLPYEELCSPKNDLCDPSAFLECNSVTGKCSCARDFETFYDSRSKTCRLIHDRPCVAEPRAQLCDRNAVCANLAPGNATYRCRCLPNFTPNSEQICYLANGDDCSQLEEDECDPDGPLICQENPKRCECANENDYYDPVQQICLIIPGGECSNGGQMRCRENSICSSEGRCICATGYEDSFDGFCLGSYGTNCMSQPTGFCNDRVNLDCQIGVCKCQTGYLELNATIQGPTTNPEMRTVCLPDYNVTCDGIVGLPDLTCNPTPILACSNGRCLCANRADQIYISQLKQCQQKAGTTCNDQRPCVPNADCILGNSTDGVCKCSSHLGHEFVNNQGLCVPGNDAPANHFSFSVLIITIFILVLY